MKKKKLSGKLILGKHKISSFASSKIKGGDTTDGGGGLPRGCFTFDICGPVPSEECNPSDWRCE